MGFALDNADAAGEVNMGKMVIFLNKTNVLVLLNQLYWLHWLQNTVNDPWKIKVIVINYLDYIWVTIKIYSN